MKIASVKEVKDKLSYYLKAAEKEDVILMKNGRAIAVLHHLGDDEMEDYILEIDPKFCAKSRDALESVPSAGRPIYPRRFE